MNAEVVPLADGAWLVMGGAMQQNYLHGVQGTQGEDEQRNALSMRQTKGHYYALYIYIYVYIIHIDIMIFYIISTRFFLRQNSRIGCSKMLEMKIDIFSFSLLSQNRIEF